MPIFYRFVYLQVAGVVTRCKFYSAWLLSEGVCTLTGISYTKDLDFSRAANVDILGVEFATSFKELIDSWNIRTNAWLKNCVYKRAHQLSGSKKPGVLVTSTVFLVSAVWHGFHPGYYLLFGLGGFSMMTGRVLRKNLRPLLLNNNPGIWTKRVYDFLGWFLTWTGINFAAAPFALWTMEKSLQCWSAVWWYGVIGAFIALFVGLISSKFSKKKAE